MVVEVHGEQGALLESAQHGAVPFERENEGDVSHGHKTDST